MTERKRYLDIMKFIGVCCLFLAHVQGPLWLEEIRGFDVPMMVFISGLLATSSIKKETSTKNYIIKRVKRLVIPTWIFLFFFYVSMFLIGQTPRISDVIKSYCFQRDCGIAGGVWIIWVYLVCAIMAPILYKLVLKKWFIPTAIAVLMVYDILIFLVPSLVDIRILYYSLWTIIPYGTVLVLGMKMTSIKYKSKWILCSVFILIHIMFGIALWTNQAGYVPISQYKYPARIYYLSYSIPVTIVLMELFNKIENKMPNLRIITFVSEHSLWIYLWQIMMLTLVNFVLKISDYWLLSWIFLMVGSILVTWIQSLIVNWLYEKIKWSFWKFFNG